MNIAAEELGRDNAFWESQWTLRTWCTGLVHPTAVQPSVKEEKENFHFLQALQYPQFFGSENMQLVQPDLFSFAVDFSVFLFSLQIWCLDRVLHYTQEYRELYLGGKILKVTLLSTF